MTTIRFTAVRRTASRSGICPICGERGTRRTTFEHTINPWNTNPDGSVKTRHQVQADVDTLAKAWSAEPFVHARCQRPEAGR